jgi:hypothetical protein
MLHMVPEEPRCIFQEQSCGPHQAACALTGAEQLVLGGCVVQMAERFTGALQALSGGC